MRQPVQRHRWASRACSTAGWSSAAVPLARSPDSRTTMPGRAEAALAGAGGAERLAPRRALGGIEAVERGDRPPPHPPGRRHARHPGLPVDEHGAAAALALGAAPVLQRADAQPLPQDVEQAVAVVGHLDVSAVDDEGHGRAGAGHAAEDKRPRRACPPVRRPDQAGVAHGVEAPGPGAHEDPAVPHCGRRLDATLQRDRPQLPRRHTRVRHVVAVEHAAAVALDEHVVDDHRRLPGRRRAARTASAPRRSPGRRRTRCPRRRRRSRCPCAAPAWSRSRPGP